MPKRFRCNICGESKSLTAFYPAAYSAVRPCRYECKRCSTALKRRYSQTERGKANKRRSDRRYTLTKKGKAARVRATVRYQRKYRAKLAAHNAVNRAVSLGRLKKQPCAICGSTRVEAHHPNYRRRLYVVWLCAKHHLEHHQRSKQ